MTQPTAEQLEVTQGFVDSKEEYAAFCIWAKNNLPFMDTPSVTSHLFSAWMGSSRHRQATEARMAAAVEVEREHGWNGALKMLDEWLVKALGETVFAKEVTIEHQEATRGAFWAARGATARLLCRDETGYLTDPKTPEHIAATIRSQSNG